MWRGYVLEVCWSKQEFDVGGPRDLLGHVGALQGHNGEVWAGVDPSCKASGGCWTTNEPNKVQFGVMWRGSVGGVLDQVLVVGGAPSPKP